MEDSSRTIECTVFFVAAMLLKTLLPPLNCSLFRLLPSPVSRSEPKSHSPLLGILIKDADPDAVDAQPLRWWDNIARLNTTDPPKPISLAWSRTCKSCGIKVLQYAVH